ncbi:MAG: uroporphyrinogen decarboxylase [Myxococcales bacterium]|nr:uroporphyrinogen decarboxylase [Myxococcales bacterium]
MSTNEMSARERMIAALRGEPTDRPPVWLMRQAGRHLPEYRAVRAGRTFMEVVRNPDLAAEVTLQPVTRYGLDAAILFSDILTIPEAMGIDVTFPKGIGPRLNPTVRTAEEVAALPPGDVRGTLDYVAGAVRETRRRLGEDTALLGFSGAPWTLACYMIEGGSSKSYSLIRSMVYREPETLRSLLDRLADLVIDYLRMQVEAGVDAVQLFDTWAGELRREDYERIVLPSTKRIIKTLRDDGINVVLFAKHPGHLLESCISAQPTAIGVDWRVGMSHAVDRAAPHGISVQGNLDPAELFASPEWITRRVQEIHAGVGGRTGHVFNLGHGVWPSTPISGVEAFVAAVKGLAG